MARRRRRPRTLRQRGRRRDRREPGEPSAAARGGRDAVRRGAPPPRRGRGRDAASVHLSTAAATRRRLFAPRARECAGRPRARRAVAAAAAGGLDARGARRPRRPRLLAPHALEAPPPIRAQTCRAAGKKEPHGARDGDLLLPGGPRRRRRRHSDGRDGRRHARSRLHGHLLPQPAPPAQQRARRARGRRLRRLPARRLRLFRFLRLPLHRRVLGPRRCELSSAVRPPRALLHHGRRCHSSLLLRRTLVGKCCA
mmetsp:Transcript_19569/g.60483  ORF Transcript_19569/g.60483 Transcript_19569/m.60483 type:complete len:254 (-) Transcript_19569:5-766(-)